ncbi:MAG: hypothetical protein ABSG78_23190 [Verrucomicrobiota bacterium]|jgi:hypothetical protein
MTSLNLEPELNSLKTKLTAEIENDLKQAEFLKKRAEKNQALLAAIRGSLNAISPESATTGYGSKSETIQNAIRALKGPFTQDAVEAEIRRINPSMEINRNRIRAALWTLSSKDKKIRVVSKGSSLKAAVYEKTEGIEPPPSGAVTPAQLEASVKSKSGRIDDLALRLNTTPESIKKLLSPASKVYVGSAGWLKVQ